MAARWSIRDKFSAQNFWDDIRDWDCTLFQYIGELCRYLVNAPPHPRERAHRLRLCCGNGLSADVWEQFQTRFRIPRILEFYAATEGNCLALQRRGQGRRHRPHAVVPHPSLSAGAGAIRLRAGEPARDDNGFCIRCATDEPGEAIGRIGDGCTAARFEGYTSEKETERKILRDVFETRRRLVPHRRSDAQGRGRLLLFRRPHRRHLPLEGRERRDLGSRRGDHGVSRRSPKRRSMASPFPEPTARPAWPRSSPTRALDLAALRKHLARRCRLMRGRCSCACETGLRSRRRSSTARTSFSAKATIQPRRRTRSISTIRKANLCAARCRALRAHRRRRHAPLASGWRRRKTALKPFADFYFTAARRSAISGLISERFRDARLP